ncbi:MAG: aminomethyl-transferring glycine dehydrogenase [Candidatus Thermoplasmatota archaeon]|nr:aminomethyl-transferring glycine dehydrogenase [Candidatus Thermoplasmatota archaeon]
MTESYSHPDRFVRRHIGPAPADIQLMLETLGYDNLSDLSSSILPDSILLSEMLDIPDPLSESEVLSKLKLFASRNQIVRSYLGHGYYGTIIPGVIKRNIMENPGWYTQYTPYQAEIAQGRLEALLNFQTMVCDLTGMEIANASLLDEATAAAEAMSMARNLTPGNKDVFLVSDEVNPQTINVVKTRAGPQDLNVVVDKLSNLKFDDNVFGVLVQYPSAEGSVCDYSEIVEKAHASGSLVVVATDLLSLCLIKPPGEWNADIVIGNSQRFGVPLGFGGPHAAFMATREKFKRSLPGRLVGVSKDVHGNVALRLALQTREQHIRRHRATSNICTAQVLLAIMSSMYAVYHGPNKLRKIAERVNYLTGVLRSSLVSGDYKIHSDSFFDTIKVEKKNAKIIDKAVKKNLNFWDYGDSIGISIDETVTSSDINDLIDFFAVEWVEPENSGIPSTLVRKSSYLTHPVFNTYHSETEMLRYVHRLESKDLSLNVSMIPLGSCTMKLNSVAEMEAVTWPEFSDIHPYVPLEQVSGYMELFRDLESWLSEITGFEGISLQPNAGSQGEYAGMLAIRGYHHSRDEAHRNVCLIPTSAHGTNPASAVMVGMKIVGIGCDDHGNIDLEDLRQKAEENSSELSAIMITYPSTHGVFEETIKEVCEIVHSHGGQVYMDGANMNAMVGLCKPGEIGADVCHLNLHKTFCIPHGGGGPGMGPIGVASHLVDFLPANPVCPDGSIGPVSATNWGSASILPISWAYIAMMGPKGLKEATQIAILNANYIAKKLSKHYRILYTGKTGCVAHECILDTRELLSNAGLVIDDIAKRLMDYGYHAPTMSWPVPSTLMVEPTESESKMELDRFCDAMVSIKSEIDAVSIDNSDNPLRGAPHTAIEIASDNWSHSYSREVAAYPAPYLRQHKFWPPVGRINNALGDRNLICLCPDVESYVEDN